LSGVYFAIGRLTPVLKESGGRNLCATFVEKQGLQKHTGARASIPVKRDASSGHLKIKTTAFPINTWRKRNEHTSVNS